MSNSPNPYAPPAADVGIGPRARGSVARYIVGIGFLLLATRDSFHFLSMRMVPEGIEIGFDPVFVALAAVLMVLRFVAALAFFLRWRFGWWLGMGLVGYSIGSIVGVMWAGGPLFIMTAFAPWLILLAPHFAGSVRSTFSVDRRGLLAGIGLLVACMGVRTVFSIAPY